MTTVLIELEDEVGNIDLCECEPAPSTRVLRTVRRLKSVLCADDGAYRTYQAQYAHACGYYN
jgi:hypothetical protein